MHEFLRSIGFSNYKTRKQLNELMDWVIENPDHVGVVPIDDETNLAMAEREISGHAGIGVVGEIDEKGSLIPEYYYPYMSFSQISSDAQISYEHQHTKNALIGMCEDYRLGMALIFSVRNIIEVLKNEMSGPFAVNYSKVSLSALASDGMVLLPLIQTEKVLQKGREDDEKHNHLMEEAYSGDISAIEKLTNEEFEKYRHVMEHLHDTDIYTLVDNFFMPHGMESDQYYFMGVITTKQLLKNDLTGEEFYRLTVVTNGIPVLVSINTKDLQGLPEIGYRFKCHAWLQGELRR